MACCLRFCQVSKTICIRIIAFLVPVLLSALLFASSSSSLLVLLMILLLSTAPFLFTFATQKPVMLYSSHLVKANDHQESTCADSCSSDDDDDDHKLSKVQQLVFATQTEIADSTAKKKGPSEVENDDNGDQGLMLIRSQHFSESSSYTTSTSSGEEDQDEDQYSSSDHSTTAEWPKHYNSMMGEKKLEDSISDDDDDEESLIEIAIQSGHFVSPDHDQHYNFFDNNKNLPKCCKVASADGHFPMFHHKDFLADMTNEEDNLIEIDIYMGSIKCSTF